MKYSTLIFIAVSFDLLGFAFSSKGGQPVGVSTTITITIAADKSCGVVSLRNYTKPNDDNEAPTKLLRWPFKITIRKPNFIEIGFSAQDKNGYVYLKYRTIGNNGNTGRWKDQNYETAENYGCDLFTTPFKVSDQLQAMTLPSGEVQLSGKDANDNSHAWTSSRNPYTGDDDVTWSGK
jgi:hypothetical protein